MPPAPDAPAAATQEDPLAPLMAAIRDGSESALGRLMAVCWPELVRYGARRLGDVEVARDIAQEAFVQVWERRRGWRPRGSVRAYLYRIVRNLVIDERRRRAVRRRWLARQEHSPSARPATPAEVLDARIVAEAFEAAVASLPNRRREVFELVFMRGLSHAEAAAVMNISAQTVANQMTSALGTVRRAVAEAGVAGR